MSHHPTFPKDFEDCIHFHGHLCPGLAIGYAAVKAATDVLKIGPSRDEEVVAIVENNSCAVDAVQVLLGCTFGKGNLIFRDWGKQVFTFMDRETNRCVRVSFTGEVPGREQRHILRKKIDSGQAGEEDLRMWEELRHRVTHQIVSGDPRSLFTLSEVPCRIPPKASIVETQPCSICRELVVTDRLVEEQGRRVCKECAMKE